MRVPWLPVILLAAACHPTVRRDGTKGGSSLCAHLNAVNAAAIAALSKEVPSDAERAALTARLRAAGVCVATPGGGWGLRFSDVRNRDGEIWGRWSIVHGSGDSAGMAPETAAGGFALGGAEPAASAGNLEWSAARRVTPAAPVLYDFDGDGEPEAVVIVETVDISESGRSATVHRGRVWQGRGTAVELFPPARELTVEELRDVDRDGRPDIVTRTPYVGFATVKCGSDEVYPVLGPALLAHSSPGGRFEVADPTAVAFATASCASTPAAVIVADRGGGRATDFARSARSIACARLRGAETAPLIARIAEACSPSGEAACPPCDDPALMERWARLRPPLHVK
jgi:hypothetical protein